MKKALLFVCSFVLFFTISSIAQKDIKGIPPEFAGYKGILLVQEAPYKKMNKVLVNKFKKFYKGEYLLVEDEINGNKTYQDVQLYPYVFLIRGNGWSGGSAIFDVLIWDRTQGKDVYYRLGDFLENSIPPYTGIGKYVKQLEEARAK